MNQTPSASPPRVSILIPSYNHAPYLPACIGCIRNQTFADWELVVVDDGSRDDSVALLNAYAEEDVRIRVYVNERNLGTYGTEQRALELAKGSLIAIMNSDDLWATEKLERQIDCLDCNPDCGLCYVLGQMVDADGRPMEDTDVHADWPKTERQEVLPYLLYENRVLASGVLFRREGLRFETTCRYSGDWVALLEFAVQGPVCCVPEKLTFWRQHETNSYVRSVGQLVEEIRVRDAILKDAERWRVPRIEPALIKAGLERNGRHLFVLAIYLKSKSLARRTVLSLMRVGAMGPLSAAKRWLATFMPGEFIRLYFIKGPDRDWLKLDIDEARKRLATQPPLEFQ